MAEEKSKDDEFNNIDVIWSSNYVRAMSTAKWFAHRNNLKVNVSDKLGERKHGINSWNELPEGFERKQILDEDYKIGYGESQREVRDRIYRKIIEIINENRDKRILIVCHATAISFLLKKWCNIEIVNEKIRYSFNGKILLEGYFNYLETFKLMFDDDDKLINIFNVK